MTNKLNIRSLLLAASFIGLTLHLFFSFFYSDSYFHVVSSSVYEDPSLRSSTYTFYKITFFLFGVIVGIFIITSSTVTKTIQRLPLTHKATLLAIVILFLLFSVTRIYSLVEIFPIFHKHEGLIFKEDGIMEYLTAVFCFIATCLILVSVKGENSAVATLFKFCIAFVFFFVAMEEISWGQRIIGWETPESMIGRNYQNETNFHNYLNPILDYLVLILNLSMCIFLAGIRKVKQFIASKSGLKQLLAVMPSDNFQIFSLVFLFLAAQAYLFGAELAEICISILVMLFAYEQYENAKKH